MDRNSDDGAQLSPKPQQIEMYPSGEYVDLLHPDPDTIHIEDIAHHLSLTCRYTGGVRKFYSVAEHCCLVTDLVKYCTDSSYDLPDVRRSALMHDAAEAYINDVTAPAKWAIRKLDILDETGVDMEYLGEVTHRSPYDRLGDNLDIVISEKFLFDIDIPVVRTADLWAMRIEAHALTKSGGKNWRWPGDLPYDGGLPGDVMWFGGLSSEAVELLFIRKYQELFALAVN